jgi:thioredoxin reductase
MSGGVADVVVVGAGPYGLSVAAHLRARGREPVVLGRAMESWRDGTPPGMRLKSEGFASSLSDPERRFTLKAFCEAEGLPYADLNLPTPVETFIAYGDAFQRRFVPRLDTRYVREIQASSPGFRVVLEDGEVLWARACVIATGLSGFATVPDALRALGAARMRHTSELWDYSGFAGKRVLVVGAGASATNAAGSLLRQGARATLTCRAPRLRFYPGGEPRRWRDAATAPMSPVGPGWRKWAATRFPRVFRALPETIRVRLVDTTLGPAPPWFVREEIEGKIEVLAGRRVVAARETAAGVEVDMIDSDGVGSTREFDHILAGTGYRVDLDRLHFLAPALRGALTRLGGAPRLDRRFQSSVPGLYFVGVVAAYHFGPGLRFVCGADFAARTVTSAISATPRVEAPAVARVPPARDAVRGARRA